LFLSRSLLFLFGSRPGCAWLLTTATENSQVPHKAAPFLTFMVTCPNPENTLAKK
ncbi:hypothetical protein L873DRAFT_1818902, partial [Choiromyces venosus 120613-1]